MSTYTKDQLLHLDLPKEFQGNFQREDTIKEIPWDFILLAVTVFFLFQDHKKTTHDNN